MAMMTHVRLSFGPASVAQERLRSAPTMTTLTREAVEILPALPTDALTVRGVAGTWMIAKVRPRSEKELARDLARAGYGYFLPLLKKVDDWKRTRYLPIPSLARYVFCASTGEIVPGYDIPTDLFYFLAEHPAVSDKQGIAASRQSRFATELDDIYSRVVAAPMYDTWTKPFIAADRKYKLKFGAFRGQEAWIDREGKRGRVWVLIESMGQKIPLEVDPNDLEPM